MAAQKMHADEVNTSVRLVEQLLMARFPDWADLPISPVPSPGTVNALYRLGEDMVVRLPRTAWAAEDVDREYTWLPRLAPLLPVPIPVPLEKGEPAAGYPWPWSVYCWLDGETLTIDRIADGRLLAEDLSAFVAALRQVEFPDAPPAWRAADLANQDAQTLEALAALDGVADTAAAQAVWEDSLRAPASDGPLAWIHGDLLPTNLLVQDGRLSAVIDFGGVGVGDPACDLIAAWSVLDADTRGVFRRALSVDDATWVRGRGWALSIALMILPYYRSTNRELVAVATRMIDEVLADHGSGDRWSQGLRR